MMTRNLLLGAVASAVLSLSASAGTIQGWYVGLEGGGNWIDDVKETLTLDGVFDGSSKYEFDSGWAALATVGHGFGSFRVELEGGYRDNDTTSGGGELSEWSVMANALYDLSVTEKLSLTLGVGAGGDFAKLEFPPSLFQDEQWNFAYQGIAGLSYALSRHLDLILTYRYLRVTSPEFADIATSNETTALAKYSFDDIVKHTATVGLRYAFGAEESPPPPPPPVAPPPPPPAPVEPPVPREFIVFFGHNQSNLTDEALVVVRQAAEAAKVTGSASLTLVGHADRSGSTAYNNALSLKRAGSVKDALVSAGVADGSISVNGKGEDDPLVPTADGVREPQNRRVHISL